MKAICLISIAKLFAITSCLSADVPTGKPQQLTAPDQVPEGLTKSDWTSIRAAYEAGRHAFRPVDGGWQARNSGQHWLTKFDGRGFVAEPTGGGWQWGLELKRYGFAGHEQAISGKPSVKAEGQRLTYDWDATVQEWFVNDAHGLEHGFTVRERPEANSDPATPLQFDLAVRGSLTAKVAAGGQAVEFRADSGALVLNYTGLKVWDADGRVLPAHFAPRATAPGVLRLLVDERGGRYPLTIDPIAQQAYLKASNTGAEDRFGHSVAVAGDILVIGAPFEDSSSTGVNSMPNESATDSGAAYVFVRSGTTWTQQAYLKASNPGENDYFGQEVSVSGETVVIGADQEDSNTTGVNSAPNENATNSGAAYVFVRNGITWTQQAYLKASNTEANDHFGYTVAVAGDTVLIGAPEEDSNATGVDGNQADNSLNGPGATYVFIRSGTTWTQQAYLKASTALPNSFGHAVAVSGNTVVVGAVADGSTATGVNGNEDNRDAMLSGAAYVFVRSGTTWTQQAYLKASNTGAYDYFGSSVSVSGDTVVVGALCEDSNATGVGGNQADNSCPNSGAAYVFVRSGTTWTQQAYLKASNPGENDYFGQEVSVSGDTVVIGASWEASNATGMGGDQTNDIATGSGAAYLFVRSGTTWTQQAYLKASNSWGGIWFGCSVAVSGNTAVVGAFGENSNATGVGGNQSNHASASSGAAYIFSPGPEIAVEQPVDTNLTDGISNINLGSVKVSSTSDEITFTIKNTGDVALTISSVSVTGENASDFILNTTGMLMSLPATTGSTGFSVTFTPSAIGSRSATLQVVSDDSDEPTFDIALTGTGLNNTPTISDIPDRTINEDANTGALSFTIGDVETAASSLTVTRASSNTVLVPTDNIVFGGSGANRTVTVTPAANQFGTATVTITVSDGSASTSDTFFLTVNPVNDAPVITGQQALATQEDTALSIGLANLTVSDIDNLYPSGFSLMVQNGTNYSHAGNILTPALNFNGTLTVPVIVNDGTANSNTFNLAVTVNSVNDVPTITNITDRTINEDTNTGALPFTIGDVETAASSLTVTRASSNTVLVPTANIAYGGSGANRTVTVTPAANQFGTATITVTVSDGSASTSDTFLLTVNPVNDTPTITAITDQTINEDTSTGAIPFTIDDVETAVTSLSVTRASSNVALVPDANVILGGSGANRIVTVTPAANQFGTTTITVTVSDGLLTASDTFLLTVTSVNDVPTISDITNQTINEDAATGVLAFTVGDIETSAGSLIVSGSSDNTTLVPNSNIVFSGSDASRSVVVTPAANHFGTATITVTVSDGTGSTSDTFLLTVNSVNDLPTINDIADQTISEDTNTGALPFTIGDVETVASSLTVTRASSNTVLVPTANIVLGGSGANRTVTVTPAANQFGTATITVTVSDGTDSASDTFLLTVNPVNDAPTITDITNQTINEDANTGVKTFTIGDMETATTSLILTGSSSNPALVPDMNIVFGGSGANRTVTVTPAANQFGTTTITIMVSDGVASTTDTFLLTVTSVNDLPTISDITNQTINEDTATGVLAFTVGDIETSVGSLIVSGSSSNTTLVPNGNIVFSGSGASRTVTVTPAANQFGTATITVTVSDGTGSTSDTFLLTVNSVNDLPTISDIADQTISEDTNTGAITFTIGDVETAVTSLTVTRASSNTVLVPTANIVLGGSGANRTVTVTPAANQFGTATITVTVSDGSASTSDTFLLTVNPVNDAPTISHITDQNITLNTLTNSLPFTVDDIETSVTLLTVSGMSSNRALVPDEYIFFGGSGASRIVTVIPEFNQIGSATITVSVSDGLLTSSVTFVVTVLGPEISVEQPFNTNIANGDFRSFGNVDINANKKLTFYIKNTGTADLTGLTLSKDGGDEAMFTITATPAASVSGPYGTTSFAVLFTPTSVGLKTAVIHIANNDPDESPFDINLTGIGVLPAVSVAVSPSSVVEDCASNLVYTFTRTGVITGVLTANFSVGGIATFDTDYTQNGATSFSTSSGSVTFAAGSATATVTIAPTADTSVENNETVVLTVAGGTGYTVGSAATATGTITNDDNSLVLSAETLTVIEGSQGSFTVQLAALPQAPVTVNVTRTTGDDDLCVDVTTMTLIFTSSNWSQPQQVRINALEDPDAANGQATFTVSSPGLTSKTVTATGNDNEKLYADWGILANLADDNALAGAIPFGDGVNNLLKYAFNMAGNGPDVRVLIPGTGMDPGTSTAGLPSLMLDRSGAQPVLRFEYLRRMNSGLVYTPRKSVDLTHWLPLSASPNVIDLGTGWERVIVAEPCDPTVIPQSFGQVLVELP